MFITLDFLILKMCQTLSVLCRNVYRKYTERQQLVVQELPHIMPTWVAFNPGNWRHLAVSTEKELTLWNVEQSNDLYYVTKRFVVPALVRSDGLQNCIVCFIHCNCGGFYYYGLPL